MKKVKAALLALLLTASFAACSNADTQAQDEAQAGTSAQSEQSQSVQSQSVQTTLAETEETVEETTQSQAQKIKAIADEAFAKQDISMSGADSRENFDEGSCLFLKQGEETHLVNDWANMLGRDVWYVEYKNKKTNMDCFYYVIGTDGEILDSGYMGV